MNTNYDIEQLNKLCNTFRKDVLTTLHAVQTGHPGGSLSVCEILTTIYFLHAKVDPKNPKWDARDRVVLCKGHAAPMLYRVLAEKGFFSSCEMCTLRQLNSKLQGHPCSNTEGVDLSTGPLGLGLSAALGMALSQRMDGFDAYTYAILGDGELNEGTVWEAFQSIAKFKPANLITIVDWNGVQLDGTTEQVMPTGDLELKVKSFGLKTIVVDGHDIGQLSSAIALAKGDKDIPTVILAKTVKGKGVSFMEGQSAWHGKAISDAEYAAAMAELEV